MISVRYKYKLVAFVQLFVLSGLIILGIVTYREITSLIEREMGMRAQGVALAASHLIKDRMGEYLELKTIEDETKPYYREMREIFKEFKASNNLKYMYTEKRISDDKIIYILDAEPSESESVSHIGDEDNMNALRYKAYQSKKPEYGPLTDDPVWGQFITGYAPLINPATGEFAGLIGVDIEGSEVFKLFEEIRIVILITILAIFAISLAITYNIADLMARPIFIDGLTGTYNHKYFQEALADEINKAEKSFKPLTILMMDLDLFKTVNDTYGHRFGDVVLKCTAKVLKDCMRREDILARYGGEEFASILPNTDIKEAVAIASRIRQAVEEHSVYCEEAGRPVNVTISIGVARWMSGMSRNEFVDRADKAMYRSKHNNRNQVTVYTEKETAI